MTDAKRQEILAKNQKLIDMVIERARADFPEDIALIGLTGSFGTGDYHEKSDLDLIIVNTTPRGWEIGCCFILDDVGYDIYCTPWEPRIEAQSKLETPFVSGLIDLQVLYCAGEEHRERLEAYRQRALELLARPIGKDCLERARTSLDAAKRHCAETMLAEDVGAVRYGAGGVASNVLYALTSMNNTYRKGGIKRYLEETLSYRYLPEGFRDSYMAVLQADGVEEMRRAAVALLKGVTDLFDAMYREFVPKPNPTADSLRGTYEELWCNCRNKVLASTASGDVSYAYHAAWDAQSYLDEMAQLMGTETYDLMKHFDARNLGSFRDGFLQAMDEYLAECNEAGVEIANFASLEDVYNRFMDK
ncbi:nucleotidyltransferase domain-containing protein [Ruminococcaceae bacterium OttesenSCG-928-L11]|nr:nucleotidyltransferase domain-containing protein [Ruminococcaceae bacterium OttesenSCG-928-L11]